jgi:prepilin-type N-terminal cleavage/methylation domain-containing protein
MPLPAGRSDAGFTLIELMLVVTITGTLAAIAIPSLARARGAAAEASTIGSVRALVGAQTSYATSCGYGYYAPTVASLAKPPSPKQPAFIGAEFKADTTDRQRYRIRFTAGTVEKGAKATCNGVAAGKALSTYFVGADLLQTTGGMSSRYFGANQTGTVYESTKRIAAFYTGAPAAPARPLR